MKKSFLLLLAMSTSLWSQSNLDVVKQVDVIQDPGNKTTPSCSSCEASRKAHASLYSPQDALRDLNSGDLKFIGRDLFPGSDQNRTCVFKNDVAYVLYNNCMGNRKEPPALDIEIIPFSGGIIRFYVENWKNHAPISSLKRSEYDGSWSVSLIPSEAPGNFNLQELKSWKAKFSAASGGGGCYIGNTGGAQDMSTKGNCYGKMSSSISDWNLVSSPFWQDPGEEFYSSHKKLRKLAETVKF